MTSSMPPTDIDETSSDPEEHTATCPVCGGECIHPYLRVAEDDYEPVTADWSCCSCDYYYEGDCYYPDD